MKMIPKTNALLLANKAESMAEVTVAFMVLTIVMSLFAQGMKFALTAENYAIDRTRDSDLAMKKMLDTAISNADVAGSGGLPNESLGGQDLLKLKMYYVTPDGGGDRCVYYVYDANLD